VRRLGSATLLLAIVAVAVAAPLTGGFWIDASGDASAERAWAASEAGEFTPFDTMLALGFVAAPVWVRLDLQPHGSASVEGILRLRPPWHDRIELFDPASPTSEPRVTGDRYPWTDDEYRSLDLNFRVASGDAPRSVLLRIDSPHSLMLSAEWFPLEQAMRVTQRQLIGFVVYVAFLAFILFGTLSTWLVDRDPLFGAVSLAMTVGILYAVTMFGMLRMLSDEGVESAAFDRLGGLLIVAYPLAAVWFYRVFLGGYVLQRWARIGLDVVAASGLVSLGFVAVGWRHLGFVTNVWVLLAAHVWLLISLWFGLRGSPRGAVSLALVRGVTTFAVVVTFLGTAHMLGPWGNRAVTMEAYLIPVLVVSVLQSLVLRFRARQRNLDLIRAQQRAATELQARENLQRFMDMFSHEVRTPLSIISLVVEQGVADPLLAKEGRGAIGDLDRLVARSLQVDALEAAATKVHLEEVAWGEMVIASAERLGLGDVLTWQGDVELRIRADAWLAQIVLGNLLENAAKYGVAGAPIVVSAVAEGPSRAVLRIENRVDARGVFDPERVFDKYYRSPQATRSSGAGLGLHLSKALAELQGGTLRLAEQSDERVAFEWRVAR
jgi:two-component system, sensor histidine kinase LadS